MTNNSGQNTDVRNNGSTFPGNIISYSCKVRLMVLVCFVLLASALALIYFLLVKSTATSQEHILALPKKLNWFPQCPSTLLEPIERFNCYPEDRKVSKELCETRGCCYLGPLTREHNNTFEDKVPICVYPSNYGYEASSKAAVSLDGFEVPLRRIPAPSRYGDDFQTVYMKVEMQTKYRLRIKFYDPENTRYEVPVPKILTPTSTQAPTENREIPLYSITYNTFSSPFSVKVRRSNTDTILFDTSPGALILSNQFIEITSKIPSLKLFGLGLQNDKSQQNFDWKTYQLFSSLTEDGNFASSVHPFYLCIEDDGNSHGVLLLNSNAMEVHFHPSPAITYRTIGGVLDFYIFLGPSPDEVIQQYTEAVGRSLIPPYWSLGFHVGFEKYQSVDEIIWILDALQTKYIPVESLIVNQGIIQKYLSGNKEYWHFSNITAKLMNKSQKLQIHFEPGILKSALLRRDEIYNVGSLSEVFVTDKWGLHPVAGKNENEDAFFPDFGSSTGFTWWSHVINKISSAVDFHGFWLANNEPLNAVNGSISGCLTDDLNNPPYIPTTKQNLYDHSLCMDSLLHWRDDVISFYDYHNLYGHSMIMATEQAFNMNNSKKRRLIISDSTFVGSGQYSGHWIKGLENSWDGLRNSISAVIQQGLYGLALAGSYVCNNANENLSSSKELCLRWLQLAVFFPYVQFYSENAEYLYNAAASSNEFIHAARHAISRRYELLPHLYTLFYLAHTNGSTIIRPLFHEFPDDNETYSIDSQFLWGSSLLISPILKQGSRKLDFYLPQGLWYDFYQGTSIFSSGEWFVETGGPFDDTKQPAVIHIRAGSMIVLQKPAETTFLSRQNSMSLLVALDTASEATGLLFWDDGETKNSHILGEYILVDFVASGSSFVVTGNFGKKAVMSSFYRAIIQQVRIMGLPKPPKRIIIDGSYILSNKQYYWNYDTKVLDLKHILIPLARRTEVHWYF